MSTGSVQYAITATRVEEGRTVDLLAFRTVQADKIDDTCQELRTQLRPTYGESLHLAVKRH
jgi:hypothetical protein